MSSPSKYRRNVNRCTSIKVETNGKLRSWRCDLVDGHNGYHESHSGHRRWLPGQIQQQQPRKASTS